MNLPPTIHKKSKYHLAPIMVGVFSFFISTSIFANPVLNNVAAGQATVQQTQTTTTVNQTSQKAIINWQSFNIGGSEHTHFQQPNGGVTLNRINPTQGASEIYGRLTATGQIILVNPAGIYFGPNAYVNVGGIIASTANISNEDFLNGYYQFSNDPNYRGAIINQGHIIAADNGLVALIGGAIRNDGMIQANIGNVVLASGDTFTMSLAGNNLVSFSIDEAVTGRAMDYNGNEIEDGIRNTGDIIANGGQILISARAASGVLDHVINMEGIAQAHSAYEKDGSIVITGDPTEGVVRIAGVLDAREGGHIETSGHRVDIESDAIIVAGSGGSWLLDPPTIYTSTYGSIIQTLLNAGTDVTLSTGISGSGDGDIFVDSAISWTTTAALMFGAYRNIDFSQPISVSGGGGVIARADLSGNGTGTVSFTGSGSITADGPASYAKLYYNPTGGNYFSPTNFTSNLLGTAPQNQRVAHMLIHDKADFLAAGAEGSPSIIYSYALASDIDMTGTPQTAPIFISGFSSHFQGNIDGHDYATGTNRTISNSSSSAALLVDYNAGLIENINYTSASVTTAGNASGVVWSNYGTISNVNFSGTVMTTGGSGAGGITLENQGIIKNASVSGTVTTSGGLFAGGITGYLNNGASIIDSYNAASVSGSNVGGLVGLINGSSVTTITNSYNVGSITGSANHAIVGNIANSGGTFTGIYWNSDTSSTASAYGGSAAGSYSATSLSDAAMQVAANFAPFDFTNTWTTNGDTTYPELIQNTAIINSTPIAGTLGAAASGQTVSVYADNTLIGTDVADAAGVFVIYVNPDTVYVSNPAILMATTSGAVTGDYLGNFYGPIGNFDIVNNTVTVRSDTGTSISNANLAAETNANLYSAVGNDITLNSNADFLTSAENIYSTVFTSPAAPFTLNGNISATDGDMTFNGNITVGSANPNITTSTTGNIAILGNVDGGANAITINTVGVLSTIDGVISNLTNIYKLGSGTLALTANNTYTGDTNISSGVLSISTSNNLGDSGNSIILGGGELFTSAGITTTRAISLTGNSTITIGSGIFDYDGTITGTGTLTLNGPGDFDIANNITTPNAITANSNIGTFTFGGTEISTSNGNLDLSSGVTLTNSSNIKLDANGSGADLTLGDVTWTGTNTVALESADQININGAISGINGGLTLTAANTSQSIETDYVNGSIDVYDFHLITGQWYQLNATLPEFKIRRSFTLANDVAAPSGSSRFLRALGGNGTSGNPYQLTDIYGIQGINSGAVNDMVHRSFMLANDIDATGTRYWNDGKGFHPIGYFYSGGAGWEFNGHFNGNNKVIDGLYINRSQTSTGSFGEMGSGLFAVTWAPQIYNLGLTNVDITSQNERAAALVAFASWQSWWTSPRASFSNIYVTGKVTSHGSTAGGILGYFGDGTVSNSYNAATVTAYGSGTAAGIVGYMSDGGITTVVNNVYNIGTVQALGTGGAGGITYILDNTDTYITNSYNSGSVTGGNASRTGAVVGYNGASATPPNSNNFWDTETSNVTVGAGSISVGGTNGITGKTTAEMMQAGTFTGWSITNIAGNTAANQGATPPATTWLIFNDTTRPILTAEWSENIRTAHQLQLMAAAVDADYKLINDIDLSTALGNRADIWNSTSSGTTSDQGFYPIGYTDLSNPTSNVYGQGTPIGSEFSGSFDGDGFIIDNLYMNYGAGNAAGLVITGFFGGVNGTQGGTVIQNVALTNVNITGYEGTGSIAGTLGDGTIRYSYASGTVTHEGGPASFGSAGGFVSSLVPGNPLIHDSYAMVDVTSTDPHGAFTGWYNVSGGTISNSYATGSVSAGGYGFAHIAGSGTLANNYYDSETTGAALGTGTGVMAFTTAEMVDFDTPGIYNTWDITATPSTTAVAPSEVWFIFDDSTRPILMMEYKTNIRNPHQLQLAGSTLGGDYTVISNIDLGPSLENKGEVWGSQASTDSGRGFAPIGIANSSSGAVTGFEFRGNFDGQGYIIDNLYINDSSNSKSIGLFSGTYGGNTIQNIALTNIDITGGDTTGGLIGQTFGTGGTSDINNIYISGNLIQNSSSGYYGAGGLIGVQYSAAVSNSYSTVNVTGNSIFSIGGFVGNFASGSITNSYSSGVLSGGATSTCGFSCGVGTVTNGFWDTQSSQKGVNALLDSVGAIPYTTAELMDLSTFTNAGWDITSTASTSSVTPNTTWFIFAGNTRPMLMMEHDLNINNNHQLQLMGAALGGDYALNNNINFSTTTVIDVWGINFSASPGAAQGFAPIGNNTNAYTGNFDGRSNTINSLKLNSSDNYLGLFGVIATSGSASNVGMTNTVLLGSTSASNYVGGIAGLNNGLITNSYVTGSARGATYIGGIAGRNTGTISDSYSTSSINGLNYIGGIAGENSAAGSVTNTYNTGYITNYTNGDQAGGIVGRNYGTVSSSFNTGTINYDNVLYTSTSGGIAGDNYGMIQTSYNTGMIAGQFANSTAGGIAGWNRSGATIQNSYNMGNVAFENDITAIGGIAGQNDGTIRNTFTTGVSYAGSTYKSAIAAVNNGTIINSFWDTAATGSSTANATNTGSLDVTAGTFDGSSGANLSQQTTYCPSGNCNGDTSHFDFANTWAIAEDRSYPYLKAFYSTAPRFIVAETAGISNKNTTLNSASLAVNGTIHDSITYTNANGLAYFVAGHNLVSNIDTSIADDAAILLFTAQLDPAPPFGPNPTNVLSNIVFKTPTSGGSNLTGSIFIPADATAVNTVTVGTSDTSTISNTDVANAVGSLGSNADILYTVSGSDVTLKSSRSLISTSATTYDLNGNLSASSANITLNGPVNITAASPIITTTTSGNIIIAGNVNGNSNAFTINNAGSASLVSGSMSDLTGFTKSGAGTLVFTGSNTYTGDTSISAGTLQIGDGNATGTLGFGAVDNNASLVFNRSDTFTVSNAIGGTGSVTKSGNNTVIFTGANDYDGTTTISGGTLQIGNGGSTGTLGDGNILNSGALSFNRNNAFTVSNIISGTGSVSQDGSSTLTLDGASTFSGGMTLNSGTLTLGSSSTGSITNGPVGTGTLTLNGGTLRTTGGTISIANNYIVDGSVIINPPGCCTVFNLDGTGNLSSGLLSFVQANNNVNLNGNLTGSAPINIGGGHMVTFAGADNIGYSGTITTAGRVGIGTATNALGTGDIVLNNGAILISTVNSAVLNNPYSVSAGASASLTNGSFDLDMAGAGTFNTGSTTAVSGTISGSISGDGTLTTPNSELIITSGNNTGFSGDVYIGNTAGHLVGTLTISNANNPFGTGEIIAHRGTLRSTVDVALDNNLTTTGVGGSLSITGSNDLALNGDIDLSSGTVIIGVSNTGTTTFGGSMTGADPITKSGAGTLILSGTDNSGYSGNYTISGGTLQIGDGGTTGSLGTGNVTNNAMLAFNRSDNLTYSNVISGTGSIEQAGSGILILTGANSYNGTTTISSGTLQVGNGGSSGQLGAGNVVNNSELAINRSNDYEIDAVISGSGSVTQNGSGTLTLSGVNTYTGATAINNGSISIGADSGLGATPGTATAGHLTLNGGTLETTATLTLNSNRGISLGISGGTLDVTTGSLTYGGIIAGSGNLIKTGSGAYLPTGSNTYTGTTTLNGGSITMNSASSLGDDSATNDLIIDGGTLGVQSGISFGMNRNITVGSGNAVISIGGGFTGLTINGVVSGSGSLTKVGGTRLVMNGSNTYTGDTILSGGILRVGNPNAFGSGGNLSVNSGTILEAGFSQNLTGINSILLNGGTIDISGANSIDSAVPIVLTANSTIRGNFQADLGSDISGAFHLTYNTGSVKPSGNNTYSGGTTISNIVIPLSASALGTGDVTIGSSGELRFREGYSALTGVSGITVLNNGLISSESNQTVTSPMAASIPITLDAAARVAAYGNGSLTLANNIGGTGSLTSIQSGTVVLSGNNTFAGELTISNGTVQAASPTALGSTAAGTTIGASGTLQIANTFIGGETLTINGGTLASTGTSALVGNILLGANSTVNVQLDQLTFNGVVDDGAGTFKLIKTGPGELRLPNAHTHKGGIDLDAGILAVGSNNSFGNGTFTFNGGAIAVTTADLNISRNIILNADLGVTGSNNFTLSGDISGAGHIINKSGTSTVTLAGNNSFGGGLNITAGTIVADSNSALGTGTTTINTNTTLQVLDGRTITNSLNVSGNGATGSNGALVGSGSATINSTITLAGDTLIGTSTAGDVLTLGGNINGANALTINGPGVVEINNDVGNTTPLTGITANSNLMVNADIVTNGNQTFNNPVTLTGDSAFTLNGNTTQSISFNDSVSGTQNLSVNGTGTGTYNFTFNGNLTQNSVTVDGGAGSTNNALNVNSGNDQTFMITTNAGGNITGITGISNNFNFNNIHNLTGGTGADHFTLDGGSISGSVNGAGGTNTLQAANVSNTWNITSNNGGSVTGIGGLFSNMQNLMGGTGLDIFNFTEGFNVAGIIDGGDLVNLNNIRFNNYTTRLDLYLSLPTSNVFNAGNVYSAGNSLVAGFTRVQQSDGNSLGYITLPDKPNITVTYYDSTLLNGEIGDPFYFYGWTVGNPPSTIPNVDNNEIASINEQPIVNDQNNNVAQIQAGAGGTTVNTTILNTTKITPINDNTSVQTGAACYTTGQ